MKKKTSEKFAMSLLSTLSFDMGKGVFFFSFVLIVGVYRDNSDKLFFGRKANE
jgi:hypothetical protein